MIILNEAQIVNLPSLIMASAFTSDLEAETEETTESDNKENTSGAVQ